MRPEQRSRWAGREECCRRYDGPLRVDAVLPHAKCGQHAYPVALRESLYSGAESFNNPRRLIAHEAGQRRLERIEPGTEGGLGSIEADCLNAQPNLARGRD